MRSTRGIPKASVLPDPVGERTSTFNSPESLPVRVGVVPPSDVMGEVTFTVYGLRGRVTVTVPPGAQVIDLTLLQPPLRAVPGWTAGACHGSPRVDLSLIPEVRQVIHVYLA